MNLKPLPAAPRSIQKGTPLKDVVGAEAIACLAYNLRQVDARFDDQGFERLALAGLEPLGIMARGQHIAQALRAYLPPRYDEAIAMLLASMAPTLSGSESQGLAVFFYLPHTRFVSTYGLAAEHNGGDDPFEVSMRAQYELTQRFTAEFSIRPFLIEQTERTLAQLLAWTRDPNPHVRRLCSEGSRPRLPWAMRIPAFVSVPGPTLAILEALRNDESLYVRRSVANHLGDIAKDHPVWVYALCERWLAGADKNVKWLIRHALRHPAKQGDAQALALRLAAKG